MLVRLMLIVKLSAKRIHTPFTAIPVARKLLMSVLFAGIAVFAYTQNTMRMRKCGSEIDWKALRANPVKWKQFQQQEQMVQKRVAQLAARGADVEDREYIIPVVFHIVDPNPNSITDDDINFQLIILNRAFSGVNEDRLRLAPLFIDRQGQSKFKFVMARRSPEGCDTNGITRTVSNLIVNGTSPDIKYTAKGGIDAWDSYDCKYLNIWVGNVKDANYATFPNGDQPIQEQGVVISKRSLFTNGGELTGRLGRTLVHETGHFFYLIHIWGDSDGCQPDDLVTDTPEQDKSSLGLDCPEPDKYNTPIVDPCSPDPPGLNYQNYMDYSPDDCKVMFTKGQVARMIPFIESPFRQMLIDPGNKALVAPRPNEYFNMCIAPAFTTNEFTTIGVGKGGYVWAGTSRQGIYKYNGTAWEKYNDFANNLILDIKADKKGGIWIAQSGYILSQNTAQKGGINYFPDSNFTGAAYYSSLFNGLPSRAARGLFIDTSRTGPIYNPAVYTANAAHSTVGESTNGGIGKGLREAHKDTITEFARYHEGLDTAYKTASVYAIGGDTSQLWAIAPNNFGKTQIIEFKTGADTLLRVIDATTDPGVFPSENFDGRAVYFDRNKNRWIGFFIGGLVVRDSNANWHVVNSASLLPAGVRINNNAITGDKLGNVFIGTDNGLLVYKGGPLDRDSSYKRYTTSNGLPSNNVKGICIDTLRKKLLIATDNGIVFWEPPCLKTGVSPVPYVTASNGDLNNASTWCGGEVPPSGSNVIVRHAIEVTTSTNLNSVRVENGGNVVIHPPVLFNVTNK